MAVSTRIAAQSSGNQSQRDRFCSCAILSASVAQLSQIRIGAEMTSRLEGRDYSRGMGVLAHDRGLPRCSIGTPIEISKSEAVFFRRR
jgi:hypothetical protein